MFSAKLKQFRSEAGYSQAALSKMLGVSQQAVGKWETGKSEPDFSTIKQIAAIFQVSTDDLMEHEAPAAFRGPAQTMIPVVGTVRAGYGALAFEEDYGTEAANVKDPENYFYLVVRGDSMMPRINEGDLALVHRQPVLENGDLGVVVFGEDGEATLKRFLVRGSSVVLQPFNPAYPAKIISGPDLEYLHIVGKVVKTVSMW